MTDLEKEVIGELIEELKVHRCLWDSKCEAYANRDSRRVALGVLLNIFKKIQPDATIDAMKKKIENLKCSFRRELRKVKASETTGASSCQVYTPKLWFYDLLLFLEEKEMTREGVDTLEEDSQMDVVEAVGGGCCQGSCEVEVQEWSDQQQHAAPSSTASPPGTPIPRKRKISTLDKKKEAMFDSVQNLLSLSKSEWVLIGKSLGLQLSQLNNDQQTIAQKLISDIIFYGKRQRLTDMSFINLASTSST
ncbi:uncharacterized protein LOC111049359 [Nilaparvata lugens]|uniref:uncharacterized protein LOC111049359 n=1 Tax=Nilaparvata lugens TaxID=108931 RepID=UPI00193D9411|nr:uncharacterized protein LOC111049359 [Nilaparvata lugens]